MAAYSGAGFDGELVVSGYDGSEKFACQSKTGIVCDRELVHDVH